jgi:hypothetical protein
VRKDSLLERVTAAAEERLRSQNMLTDRIAEKLQGWVAATTPASLLLKVVYRDAYRRAKPPPVAFRLRSGLGRSLSDRYLPRWKRGSPFSS